MDARRQSSSRRSTESVETKLERAEARALRLVDGDSRPGGCSGLRAACRTRSTASRALEASRARAAATVRWILVGGDGTGGPRAGLRAGRGGGTSSWAGSGAGDQRCRFDLLTREAATSRAATSKAAGRDQAKGARRATRRKGADARAHHSTPRQRHHQPAGATDRRRRERGVE